MNKKLRCVNRGACIEVYIDLSGETFLKKGSSPNPFPKTFNTNFSRTGHNVKFSDFCLYGVCPVRLKFHTESFREGV